MKAVLKYPGAKNRLAKWICEYIPEHRNYVEPFLGSGAVFFNKKPSYLEILNELDEDVITFFKVLREEKEKLIELIYLTPYSRAAYQGSYKQVEDITDVEKAYNFTIKCWQGFGCGNKYKNGYRRGVGVTSPNPAKAWAELPTVLFEAVERLKNAQIENIDALELIESLHGKDTLIYCDPPYLLNTRKKYLYNHETQNKQHKKLLEVLTKSDCKCIISGYDNKLYNNILNEWNTATKSTTAEGGLKRVEKLWFNYRYDGEQIQL